jgi:hypothetical protein
MSDTDPNNPPPPAGAVPEWHLYHTGGKDKAGRTIKEVYELDDKYVIYFVDHDYCADHVGCELFYETTPEVKDLGKADAALAGINRLLDDNQKKCSREYNFNVSTLELAADALEMFFCGETTEALEILNGLHDKLKAKEEGQRRLMYQLGAFGITVLVWGAYLVFLCVGWIHTGWEPWILAAALAMAGGVFSVCVTIKSLEVNVNQENGFLLSAGLTRSVVALLAGIALLLAMRSKMFAGITYKGDLPAPGDSLQIAEMFFCFLSGFSESFVPNILSKAADKKTNGKTTNGKTTNGKTTDGKTAG